MKNQAIVIHENDNVATCVNSFLAGTTIHYFQGGLERSLQLIEDIPLGHKVAIFPIPEGTDIIKYAESIGRATQEILPGQHVHIHNLESKRGRGDLESGKGAN